LVDVRVDRWQAVDERTVALYQHSAELMQTTRVTHAAVITDTYTRLSDNLSLSLSLSQPFKM